jgi:general secretion pathway protein A
MYESFFGIKESPFSLTPDPAFLVMTRAHANVRAGLTYAILAGKGFTVLTGEAGTGKTTLLRSVIDAIPQDHLRFSMVTNPVLTPVEFAATAIADFGLPECDSHPARLRTLQNFLLKTHAEGKVAVLFVDEAHRLPMETLEEIRLMTNFETRTKKLLQIVLAGQDELGDMLSRHDLRQLKQRVEVWLNIGPLAAGEVWGYIKRRWSCAAGAELPFSPEGVRLIGKVSCGIPRLINSVCDNSLLLAFAEHSRVVTAQHVWEASKDLHLTVAAEEGEQKRHGNVAAPRPQAPSAPTTQLKIPAPVPSNFGADSSPLYALHTPKRSWWWSNFSKAQKAGIA